MELVDRHVVVTGGGGGIGQSASNAGERPSVKEVSARCGFTCDYIGDWGHPRNQKMMRFVAL